MAPNTENWGGDVEDYARRLAGQLGVADFVYEPMRVAKGKGTVEVSDGVIASGNFGAILQVKSREKMVAGRDTPERAVSWIESNVEKAARQGSGTRREIGRQPVSLTSLRGYERTFSDAGDWPIVVIVHHPVGPSGLLIEPEQDRCLVITLDDWLGLNTRLRSTAGVLHYINRALDCPIRPELGREYDRYLQLALADARAPGGADSFPTLPLVPIADDDLVYSMIAEDLVEKVWPNDGPIPWHAPDDYRRIVECLDDIPLPIRIDVGRKMFGTFSESWDTHTRRSFLSTFPQFNLQIAVVYDHLDRYTTQDAFTYKIAALAQVRHVEAQEKTELEIRRTLGIGRLGGDTPATAAYAFAYVEGDVAPARSLRWRVNTEFGTLKGGTINPVAAPPRNAPCPCGSGRKFKRCCQPAL